MLSDKKTLKKLLKAFLAVFLFTPILSFSQETTISFDYTSATETWIVPPCVTTIEITAAGAEGGGNYGGNGAIVTGTFTVNPGDVLEINVGGAGSCPNGGFNGGAIGASANNAANGACGGGGASDVRVVDYQLTDRIIVAGGGGGMGGGSTDANGGDGGCTNGETGDSPFGEGGGGASQNNGGNAGPPWPDAIWLEGNSGEVGSLANGGNGATDPCYNLGPGGGGGGGYYGGGGGGSDCYDLPPLGGGGGGGGSSLFPTNGSCTQGSNSGNGYVTINYSLLEANGNSSITVCEEYDWNGQIITTTGEYEQTFTSTAGCDSIHTLNAIINNSINTQVILSICYGDSIFLQNAWQTNAGLYVDTFSTSTCDSIVETTLSINILPTITPNFVVNGNTIIAPGPIYQLTQAQASQAGSVWSDALLDLNFPFDFEVELFFGCNNGGADGIAFVLQQVSSNIGSIGGGIGYAGIAPSFGVEFDTWQNGQYADPTYDHLAIQRNGDLDHSGINNLFAPIAFPGTMNIEDCNWHDLRFSWDPSINEFKVDFDGTEIVNTTIDIIATCFPTNPNVFWGFTAATGGANNLQQFKFDNYELLDNTICKGDTININSLIDDVTLSYSWTPNLGVDNNTISSPNFYPPESTTYVLEVTNAYNCSITDTFTIFVDSVDISNINGTATCNDDGAATVSTGGNSSYYLYDWDDPNNQNTQTATNLESGYYTCLVSNDNACVDSASIEITTPLPLTSVTNITACNNYEWNNQTYDSSGSYDYTTQNSLGCDSVATLNLTINSAPTISAGTSVTICDGESVTLSGSGGFSYVWDNGVVNNVSFIPTIGTTTYTVIGTDVNNCDNTSSVDVIVNPLPEANGVAVSFCEDLNNGVFLDLTTYENQITSNPTTINWVNQMGESVNSTNYPLIESEFLFAQITNSFNCESSAKLIMELHPTPDISAITSDDICQSENYNLASISITDNNNASGYISFHSGSPANTGNQVSNLVNPSSTSLYYILSTTNNGCKDEIPFNLIVHPAPTPDAGIDNTTCGLSYPLNASQTSGTTANWQTTSDATINEINNPNSTVSVTDYGTYSFVWEETSTFGCYSNSTVNILFVPSPTSSSVGNVTICPGEEVFLDASADNYTSTSWTTSGTGYFLDYQSNSTTYTPSDLDISNNGASLTFTAVNSPCPNSTANVTVEIHSTPTSNISGEGDLCNNVDSTATLTFISTGIPPYTLSIQQNGEEWMEHTTHSSVDTIIVSQEGFYEIAAISDSNCEGTTTGSVSVFKRPVPYAQFTTNPSVAYLGDAEIVFYNNSQLADEFSWNFGDSTYNELDYNPIHNYTDTGVFQISLQISNEFGCTDSVTHTIIIHPNFHFYLPNAFTPNGDNENDTFIGKGEGIADYQMTIFNRWGAAIFYSNSIEEGWDGVPKSASEISPNGVYSYKVDVTDLLGKKHTYTGEVSLLR